MVCAVVRSASSVKLIDSGREFSSTVPCAVSWRKSATTKALRSVQRLRKSKSVGLPQLFIGGVRVVRLNYMFQTLRILVSNRSP